MKIAYISDIHYTDRANESIVYDVPWFRCYSSASAKVREFFRITKRYEPDIYFIGGDIVDSSAADASSQVTQFKADADAMGIDLNNKGLYLAGNHDYLAFGNDPDAFLRGQITLSYMRNVFDWWPTGFDNWCAWFVDIGGIRLIGLCTVKTAGGNFDDEAFGSIIGDNQRDWLNEVGGPLDTANLIIVFSHAHLTTISGQGFAYNHETDNHVNIRSDFETAGVNAVLAGHWHKGTAAGTGSMVDIVNGIPYYGLRSNVLGRHTSDFTLNSFYLFDIDATKGIQRITQFKRDQFGRSRTNIGVFPNDKQFGRDRYSF